MHCAIAISLREISGASASAHHRLILTNHFPIVKRPPISHIFLILATALFAAASCNKHDDDTIDYTSTPSVAVTNFTLKANPKVMANLDSVFFSIDIEHGVIFNADSLPKGTDVSRLLAVISYPATVAEAIITMGATDKLEEQTIDYRKNPSDSIDFTRPVTISLTAADGTTKASYRIKVNVHHNDPDSLIWDRLAVDRLPSRLGAPKAIKTASIASMVYCLIEERDASYTMATTESPMSREWTRLAVAAPEPLRVSTLRASAGELFILGRSGALYRSPDGCTWSATGHTWINILGDYSGTLLGIAGDSDTGLRHASFPESAALAGNPIKEGFPVDGFSNLGTISSSWASSPTAILTGGILPDGSPTGATWAFDGSSWAKISAVPVPDVSGATMFPYHSYRKTSTSWIQTDYDVWMLLGGTLADGSLNHTLYISYDNGVTWLIAPDLMQLPEFIPAMTGADAIVASSPMSADLADAWNTRANPAQRPWMKIAYNIDGYEISWECPYLFLFGGYGADAILFDSIWRGVLARLTYTPLI